MDHTNPMSHGRHPHIGNVGRFVDVSRQRNQQGAQSLLAARIGLGTSFENASHGLPDAHQWQKLRQSRHRTLGQEESNHLFRCVGTADIRKRSAGMTT